MQKILSNAAIGNLFDTEQATAPAHECAAIAADVLDLFDALQGGLLRYTMSLGLTRHDAEDVLQESFLALFRHLEEGRSRSNLRGWLFRVAHHLSLKRRLATQRQMRTQDDGVDVEERCADPAPNPEDVVLFTERQDRLRAVVSALPETDRWCLTLRAEGLRLREIAAVVGISLGSVAASLTRSLARLARSEAR